MRATLSVLFVFTAGLALPALAQTPLEDAELEYTRGLYALNADDLGQAAERFHSAASAFPQEARYWYDLGRVEKQDLHTLDLMAGNEADEFYDDIMANDNPRNIDAAFAGYTFLQLLPGVKGQLVHYGQAFHPFNTVTFAGLVF